MRKLFIVAEWSETAQICIPIWRILLNRLASRANSSVIWWHTPGYSSLLKKSIHISADPPAHLADDEVFKSDKESIYIIEEYLKAVQNEEDWLKKARSVLGPRSHISISDIHYITSKGVRVGRYISSHLLRFRPDLADGRRLLECGDVIPLLASVLREQYHAEALVFGMSSPLLLMTEAVYLGGATLESLISSGGVYLDIASAGVPVLVHKQNISSDLYSKSPLLMAAEAEFLRQLSFKDSIRMQKDLSRGVRELEARISDNGYLNSAATDYLTSHLRGHIVSRFSVSFMNRSSLEMLIDKQSSLKAPVFIFYLHCFADGPYLQGYSGFTSSYDYFVYIAECIASAIRSGLLSTSTRILLRLHPNLLLGNVTNTEVDLEKGQYDLELTERLLTELIAICPESYVLDPSITSKELLDVKYAIYVTHHGSVGYEALYMKKILLCTCTAPYSGLRLGEIVISPGFSFLPELVKRLSASTENKTNTDVALVCELESRFRKISPFYLVQTFMGTENSELYKWLKSSCRILRIALSKEEYSILEKAWDMLLSYVSL